MTTLSIQMTADRDNLITSLALAQDLILTMDPLTISPDDQEIVMAAKLLQATIARRAGKSTPDFCHSQTEAARLTPKNTSNCTCTYSDMARAISAKNPGTECRDTTLRKRNVLQYLEDKEMADEFATNLPGRTKTKFSAWAVNFVAEHYQGLLAQGWREVRGRAKPRSGPAQAPQPSARKEKFAR